MCFGKTQKHYILFTCGQFFETLWDNFAEMLRKFPKHFDIRGSTEKL